MSAMAPKPVVDSNTFPRKGSLKEQPSYLKEVSVALTRREELLRLRERMSAAKLIMDADPSAKPWLLSRSISNNTIQEEVKAATIPRRRKVSKDSRSSRDTEDSSEISED